MLHALDVRANYWVLWTESANLRAYNEKYPRGSAQECWISPPSGVGVAAKRNGAFEIIVAVANRGVSGVAGTLWLHLETADGRLQLGGSLDRGQPYGGGVREASFLLPHGFTDRLHLSGRNEMRSGVKEPVAWGCEQPVNSDGSITIDMKSENYPGWRKGV